VGEHTFCDVYGMAGEAGTLPHEGVLLWKQGGHFAGDELIAHRLVRIWIYLGLVAHFPCS